MSEVVTEESVECVNDFQDNYTYISITFIGIVTREKNFVTKSYIENTFIIGLEKVHFRRKSKL